MPKKQQGAGRGLNARAAGGGRAGQGTDRQDHPAVAVLQGPQPASELRDGQTVVEDGVCLGGGFWREPARSAQAQRRGDMAAVWVEGEGAGPARPRLGRDDGALPARQGSDGRHRSEYWTSN